MTENYKMLSTRPVDLRGLVEELQARGRRKQAVVCEVLIVVELAEMPHAAVAQDGDDCVAWPHLPCQPDGPNAVHG